MNAKNSTNPKLQLVPGYVHDINGVARKAGLRVELSIGEGADGKECALSTWAGPFQQFLDTQLFTASARFPLFDEKDIAVTGCRFLGGRITKRGTELKLEERDRLPFSKTVQNGVERMDFGTDGADWYGSREDLLAAGILTERHFPITRNTKRFAPDYCNLDPTLREWTVELRPGGKYVYWVQSTIERMKEIGDRSDFATKHTRQYPHAARKVERDAKRSLGPLPPNPCDMGVGKLMEAMRTELHRIHQDPAALSAAIREAQSLYHNGKEARP